MHQLGNPEFNARIGRRLRQERRLAGVTRREFADLLGTSTETIEKYERGQRQLRASQLAKAAVAFDLSLSTFFYDKESATETQDDTRWVTIRRPPKLLACPSFARAVPFLHLWKVSRGTLTEDIENALLMSGILDRTIILRRPPGTSRFITEHFGSRIVYLRQQDIVGREILEQPDPEYAASMVQAYTEVLGHREVIVEACRAVIRTWDHKVIGARYDRVLLPWRWRGSDQYAMCISLRRGRLDEMDAAAAVLPP